MPAAKNRVLRSTQTSPNVGTVRDLTAAFGAGAVDTTVAAFATAGTVTTIRYSPTVTATAAATIPTAGAASAQVGWRDTVGEVPGDQVTYAAGTWSTRLKFVKTGQTVAADQTIRITAITYRVNAAGAFQAEIGRFVSADTVISTAALAITGSFTTGSPTVFPAGDKVQIEVYIQPITAGIAAAPAAAVNFVLRIEEASANTPSQYTAIPAYQTQFVRAVGDTAGATDTLTRQQILARSLAETAGASDNLTRVAIKPRALPDSAPASDNLTRVVLFKRSLADVAGATDNLTRVAIKPRALADSAPASDTLTRVATFPRALTETAGATDNLTRVAIKPRALTETAGATDSLTRSLVLARVLNDTAGATDNLTRVLIYVRQLTENIGPSGSGGTTIVKKFFYVFDD